MWAFATPLGWLYPGASHTFQRKFIKGATWPYCHDDDDDASYSPPFLTGHMVRSSHKFRKRTTIFQNRKAKETFTLCTFWQNNLSKSSSFALLRNLLRSKFVVRIVTRCGAWPPLVGVTYSVYLHAPSYILRCLFTRTILNHQNAYFFQENGVQYINSILIIGAAITKMSYIYSNTSFSDFSLIFWSSFIGTSGVLNKNDQMICSFEKVNFHSRISPYWLDWIKSTAMIS